MSAALNVAKYVEPTDLLPELTGNSLRDYLSGWFCSVLECCCQCMRHQHQLRGNSTCYFRPAIVVLIYADALAVLHAL
jgi:hypothetical protein